MCTALCQRKEITSINYSSHFARASCTDKRAMWNRQNKNIHYIQSNSNLKTFFLCFVFFKWEQTHHLDVDGTTFASFFWEIPSVCRHSRHLPLTLFIAHQIDKQLCAVTSCCRPKENTSFLITHSFAFVMNEMELKRSLIKCVCEMVMTIERERDRESGGRWWAALAKHRIEVKLLA